MEQISAKFRFNKAGQGCFYSGFFKHFTTNNYFSMVYDCGTDSSHQYLENEILKFKTHLKIKTANKLNLLIISHFDRDHVNKIKYLLDGLTQVDTLILPYLFPEERLWLYLKTDEPEDDYTAFLTDPISFLNSIVAINEIIFINNENGESDGTNNTEFDPTFKTFLSLQLDNKLEYQSNDKVKFSLNSPRLFINGIWEFYFYNKPVNKSYLDSFVINIKKEFPELTKTAINIENIKEIFATKNIKLIRTKYNKNFNLKGTQVNSTSLLVLHQPLPQKGAYAFIKRRRKYRNFRVASEFPATFLMGDIYLNGLTFPAFITNQFEKISFLQIPHHGAETLWDFNVINKITHRPINAIINFGLGNKHEHPKSKVLNDLKVSGWKITLTHQLKSFKYKFYIIF